MVNTHIKKFMRHCRYSSILSIKHAIVLLQTNQTGVGCMVQQMYGWDEGVMVDGGYRGARWGRGGL